MILIYNYINSNILLIMDSSKFPSSSSLPISFASYPLLNFLPFCLFLELIFFLFFTLLFASEAVGTRGDASTILSRGKLPRGLRWESTSERHLWQAPRRDLRIKHWVLNPTCQGVGSSGKIKGPDEAAGGLKGTLYSPVHNRWLRHRVRAACLSQVFLFSLNPEKVHSLWIEMLQNLFMKCDCFQRG